MKISILIFDLSDNAIVRTYPIAKILSKRYKVEVIGPILGKEIYPPYCKEFKFKSFRIDKSKSKIVGFYSLIKNILNAIDGDIVYAFKPKLTSFGIGLIAKFLYKKPLILDIEDFESVDFYNLNVKKKILLIFRPFYLNNELFNFLIDLMIPLANKRIVVSHFLKKRYGGAIIRHGPNLEIFNPLKYNRNRIKKELKLSRNVKYILFSGYPREHKGIKELILAVKNINRSDLKLLIVGGSKKDKFLKYILSIGGRFVDHYASMPHNKMPELLAATDIVVIPQRKTLFAMAQIPAKVFEAMAMEKPIISTNVSDMAEILKGCGVLIQPSTDTTQLEEKIELLINNEKTSKSLGQKARKRCEEKYSWDVMEKKINSIFDEYLHDNY